MKKKNVPKIRFPGFTEPWEQRKFKEIAETRRGLTYSPSNICNNGVRVLRSSNINEESFEISEDDVFVDEQAVNIPYIKNGDILITAANGSSRLVGKHTIIHDIPDNSAVHGGFMLTASTSYPDFLNASMSSSWYSKFISVFVVGGNGAIGNLNKNDLDEQIVLVPSESEQIKIGAFFKKIDNLISLHQRKLENLKKQKKGLLQKMFPEKGKKVPEIRFPEFTDDWEQRKLGEIAERVTRKNTNLESTLPLTISAQYGLVDQITFFNKRVASRDLSNYLLIKKGEFAYNKSYSDGYPFGAIKRLERYDMGVLSSLYIVFKPNNKIINSDYLTTYYDTNCWHKQVSDRAAEGARNHGLLNISSTDFFDTELKFPKELKEQEQIGNFFKKLDNLISLHQRKLEHLQKQKKALLQQMFV